jgi:hypothetical protein
MRLRFNQKPLTVAVGWLMLFVLPASAQSQLLPCPADQNAYRHMCFGTYTIPYLVGATYVGEFRDNRRHGHGTFTWTNGDRYVGEFRNDERHGQGTYTYANGERYVGGYIAGLRFGQGSLFSSEGRLLRNGIWQNDQLVQTNNLPTPILAALPSPARPPQQNPLPAVQGSPARPPTQTTSGTRVRLIREAGTFKIPVRINGVLELQFTVDSGASDVTIPADVVRTLVRTGTISESDFIGEQTYRLADGSTIRSSTFRIRQLQVGDRTITNVRGSVANVNGSLLLGQTFLSRFQRVSFDYGQGVLVLE